MLSRKPANWTPTKSSPYPAATRQTHSVFPTPLHCFWMKIRYPGKIHRFLQSLNPRHKTILSMEREILDPANTRMIVTNSKLSKKIIGQYYDYPQERIHVIYNGVDHSQFTADTSLRDARHTRTPLRRPRFQTQGTRACHRCPRHGQGRWTYL